MSDWFSIGVGVVSGLFGGSLGSVFVAPFVGERVERGKRRHAATAAIRAALLSYRDTLRYDLEERGVRPITYASLESQERLAEIIVRELPHVGRSKRGRLYELLTKLVGSRTMTMAETRAYLPTDARDLEKEQLRLEVAERHIQLEDGRAEQHGQLGIVRRSPNEREHRDHHAAAMTTLQSMLDDVAL
ncbi:hypothetical protein [Amycolatopsis sp. NPDC051371]|uniref:hypothetical protein n=1 Tax=Amycolatopsis sp. NPDC051371 TaxID=3155800 RepID=UPI003412947B